MPIDVIFYAALLLAVIQGLRNGLVIAVFSLVGWVIGLYAAFHLSGTMSVYLKDYVSPRWLAVISFVAVFVIVLILVRLGAKLIEKAMELTMLGWINRIGGIFFYVLLYAFIISVVVLFAERAKLITAETISTSRVYPWIRPLSRVTQLSFH